MLQSLEDAAEAVKSATSSLTVRDPVAAAAQRIVDEANKSVSGDNTLEEWKAKAEKAVSCLCHWAVLVSHCRFGRYQNYVFRETRVWWNS